MCLHGGYSHPEVDRIQVIEEISILGFFPTSYFIYSRMAAGVRVDLRLVAQSEVEARFRVISKVDSGLLGGRCNVLVRGFVGLMGLHQP